VSVYGVPNGRAEVTGDEMNEAATTAARRGQALLDVGRAKEAEGQFRAALAAEPDDAALHTLLAMALLRQDRYGEARDAGLAALAVEPERVGAHAMLAGALGGLEQHEAALDAIRRALALAPEVAGLHLQHASILGGLRRPAEALASVERAGELDPDSAGVATLRAALLFELRRFDDADAAVADALRLDPESADAHRIRGMLALRRGGGRSAVEAQRASLRLDPTDPNTRQALTYALKSRNPLYGALLRFDLWLSSLPKPLRVGFLFLPLLLTRVLRPFEGQAWATVLLVLVVAFVVLTWTLEPLMNCVLLLGADRHLLTRPARLATFAFLGFAAAAVACAVFASTVGPQQLMAVALGLTLWAMVTGSAHNLDEGPRTPLTIVAGVAAGLALLAVVATVTGAPGATVPIALVVISGFATMWITAFAR